MQARLGEGGERRAREGNNLYNLRAQLLRLSQSPVLPPVNSSPSHSPAKLSSVKIPDTELDLLCVVCFICKFGFAY
ncbi:hypothetical protein MTR67_016969 [Solanum verrucosum]|uniref:Uncharacterized protein n=1 Tax=Solanum verrucosum TaxID=315347 RepID=A0AAF0QPD0_SOLVR|nr:hypothetical protein MTR67_016969 [Solanum verrucosum]